MPVISHYFHAEAHALTGKLSLPFEQDIKKQAFVKLEGDAEKLLLEGEDEQTLRGKHPQQNYLSQHAKNFRLEGIVSYAAAHTQVSGHRSKKHEGAFVTLATSMIEDLNVLNVVTADRVVGQISTTHFPDQSAPKVTFLGTHFENLRIARHRAEPFLNLATVGNPPDKRTLYVEPGAGLMKAVEKQYTVLKARLAGLAAGIRQSMRPENPAGSVATQYHGFSDLNYGDIQKNARAAYAGESEWDGITCSLVENVEIKDISVKAADGSSVQIPPPAVSFGHVIHIPDFGTIFLAELKVNHNSFHLTMIRLEMGCLADGDVGVGVCNVNGSRKPPGP